MKRTITLMLTLAMFISLCACGDEGGNTAVTEGENTKTTVAATEDATVVTTGTEATTVAETTEEVVEPIEIKIGEPIALDFVEMTFTETGVAEDIRQSITTGIVTRTTGPQPETGKKFIYLRGTIKNLDTESLPVFDFFFGEYKIDDYKFECSANECDVINVNGESETSVDPLVTDTFTIYAAVPNELADNYSSGTFRFGFYDKFDNSELSMNRAFEDDPISMCQYLYTIKIK